MLNKRTLFFVLSLVAVTFSAQIKVACIGNSITSGYSNTGFSYVPKLQKLLGSNYTVYNKGVSGTTLLKNGDSPYWRTGNIAQVIALQPDIVTIKLGTNDTKPYNWDVHSSEFKKDYEALIDTLNTSAVKPKIFLVLPVPVFINPVSVSWGIRDSIILKMIPIIKEIASERGLKVIDAHTPLVPFPQYFSVDGVHPDSNAADTIANVIYRGIKSESTGTRVAASVNHNGNNLNSAFPIVNGSLDAIFDRIKPGDQYEVSLVDAAGRSMIQKTYIDFSPASQKLVKAMVSKCATMKLIVIKRVSYSK